MDCVPAVCACRPRSVLIAGDLLLAMALPATLVARRPLSPLLPYLSAGAVLRPHVPTTIQPDPVRNGEFSEH
ncbi:MAG: hypothetical protein JWO31_2480 [Phycisphaerales bacterium]|nr:hypothetical protein [Phycisphaerales bacterium]